MTLMRRRLDGAAIAEVPALPVPERKSSRAELHVVDVLGDGWVISAHRAVRATLDVHLVELRRQRVEEQKASDERLADPGRELDRLVRLQRPDDARQHAEHA